MCALVVGGGFADFDEVRKYLYSLCTELDADGLPVLVNGKASRAPFLRELEIGKNKEGYWNAKLQAECSAEMCLIRNLLYPWVQHFEKQDHSSGHHGFAADALVSSRMNRSPAGKQPIMRNTIVCAEDIGEHHTLQAVPGQPGKYAQQMSTVVDGELVAKGAELVLFERGLLSDKMLLPDIRAALNECSDFKAEKPMVQTVIEQAGQVVHWLPKYHSPCNASEYFWGNGKKRFRIICDFTMKSLKRDGMRTLFGIDPLTARKFIRKARDYDRALMVGCNGFSMNDRVQTFKKERIYKSHIRPAPSAYNDL